MVEIVSVVDEGLGRSSHLLAARGHRQVSVLAGGPADWAAVTGRELVTGP